MLSKEWVASYLEATGDVPDAYPGLEVVPPLALTARALADLLERLDLPSGAIHGGQEIQCHRAASIGERVRISVEQVRPARRGDFRFVTASFVVYGAQGDTVLSGKSTVILPQEAEGGGSHP